MPRGFVAVILLGTLGGAGCRGEEQPSRHSEAPKSVVTGVVARVGDRAIGSSEVRARMAAEEVGVEEALRELVDEEVLFTEATRRGFVEHTGTERAVERQMVRALLRDLEAENTPESISDEELREDFELHRDKLQVPERRRSWHILVTDDSETGRKKAAGILREIRGAKDPRTVFDRYVAADPAEGIKAEDLPAISTSASMAKPYLDALFDAPSTGPLDRVVRTSYGWHAIFVAEIQPADRKTLDDVEAESRERLSQKKRYLRLAGVLDELRAEGLVELDEEAVDRLVRAERLPELAK